MGTRTFQAATMLEALTMAQKELGPSAIVLSVRDLPTGPAWQIWNKPGVEIVAMTPGGLPGQAVSPAAGKTSHPTVPAAKLDFREEKPEIEWVKPDPASPPSAEKGKVARSWAPERIQRVNEPVSEVHAAPEPAVRPVPGNAAHPAVPVEGSVVKELAPGLQAVQCQLVGQGVDGQFVDRLIDLAAETLPPAVQADEDRCRHYIGQQLAAELVIRRGLPTDPPGRVLVLVGTSGSGKTSLAARLVLFYRQALGKRVAWINADTVRTGAVAESRAYTDALGIAARPVYTPQDLAPVLKREAQADLILVDTPGYNPRREAQMQALGEILTALPNRHTILVAPATTKEADLFQSFALLNLFGLKGLALTKLDETYTYGNVYNFARKCQLPLTYFACGKLEPGALQIGDAGLLVDALFGKGWKS